MEKWDTLSYQWTISVQFHANEEMLHTFMNTNKEWRHTFSQ